MTYKLHLYIIVTLLIFIHVENGFAQQGSVGLKYDVLADISQDSPEHVKKDTTIGYTYTSKAINIKKPKYRDPCLAFIIAAVPGCFVRGAGHFYAGKYSTGACLFLGSAASIYGAILSIFAYQNAYLFNFFQVSFWGLWGYDIIVSTIICNRMYKRAQNAKLQPFIRKNQYGDRQVGMQLSYRF